MKKVFLFLLVLFLTAGVSLAQSGVKKTRVHPNDFGKVIIKNYSEQARLAPVVYDHWLHRAKFTCRLCHVDLGFAMRANETKIRAADNMNGEYCGACHNGKVSAAGEKLFPACQKAAGQESSEKCTVCHVAGKDLKPKTGFFDFTRGWPKKRFGNGVDWIEAESAGLIKLVDNLEGVSVKKSNFANPSDMTIAPKVKGMPDIIFSHDKHAVWNGCELCHPELFPSVQKGKGSAFSMNEIFEGKYCGACHGIVAFPMIECQRCHSKPVEEK